LKIATTPAILGRILGDDQHIQKSHHNIIGLLCKHNIFGPIEFQPGLQKSRAIPRKQVIPEKEKVQKEKPDLKIDKQVFMKSPFHKFCDDA
jgi:hypothetical protein